MSRTVLNVPVSVSYFSSTTLYILFKPQTGLPCRTVPCRKYSQLFRHNRGHYLKNPWTHSVSVRNVEKKSRKDILFERFYKNVYQGLAVIATSTFLYIKLIGLKLLLLQAAPIAYMLRNQLPTIKETFSRDMKWVNIYSWNVKTY